MNSNNVIRNYKHDISGKFKDIGTAIANMDESAFNDAGNNEIFHAVHEVLLKMVKTSRNTILENLKQEIVLVVSDKEPDLSLSKLQIEGVTVRYEMKDECMKYIYAKSENQGSVEVGIKVLKTFLPIKTVSFDGQLGLITKFLKESREEIGKNS